MDFGISLDPLAVPQRHTLYDSESDEEKEQQDQNEQEPFVVCENETGEASLAGKALLIGIGSTASIFVQSFAYLRKEQAFSLKVDIDKVQKRSSFLPGKGTVQDVTVFHCLTDTSSWLACLHTTELSAEVCNRWTEKVFDHGKPSHIIIYVCKSLHQYFHSTTLDEDCTNVRRKLCSSTWPYQSLTSVLLESPNTLQGETAAILTYCELHSIPCCVNILYASSSLTEKEKALCFLPSLKEATNIAGLPKGLHIKDDKEGEVMVGKLQPKLKTDLVTLYT